MISQINAKEQEELSKLAASRLMATESWNQLFSDISRLSSSTIKKAVGGHKQQESKPFRTVQPDRPKGD